MNSQTDQQLLGDYAERRSEAAFAELVRRYIDLVYSAALRMVRDAHQAEDVTQGVFVALAQNAPRLTDRPVLSGWLHRTTQNLAANAVRSDVRRRAREQEAVVMTELLAAADSSPAWDQIAPHLDAALGEVSETDRDAVLLRYFKRQSAQEMAQTLGISDEAAQKRVNRAVERLREFFARHGVSAGPAGMATVISANAVQGAPAGLAVTATTAAISAGSVALVGGGIAAKLLSEKIGVAIVAVCLAGAGGYFIWNQLNGPAPNARDAAAAQTSANSTNEILYREMLRAAPIAGEVVEGHPTRVLWEERRATLLQAGYIESREIRLSKPFSQQDATRTFFDRFQTRFRGVELTFRRPDRITVIARKTDFGPKGAIEQFLRSYDPEKQ